MEVDDFEAKRKQVLEGLKGHKKSGRKYNIQERLKEVMDLEKKEEKEQSQKKVFSEYIGFFTPHEKIRGYVEREGERVAGFKIFDNHEDLAQWTEVENPNLIIVDVDSPVNESDILNLFAIVSMTGLQTKICILSDRSSRKLLAKLCAQGAIAILSKPIQLLEVKHIMEGNIPAGCGPLS